MTADQEAANRELKACQDALLAELDAEARQLADLQIVNRERLAEMYKAASGKAHHASNCSTSRAPAYIPQPCDCEE